MRASLREEILFSALLFAPLRCAQCARTLRNGKMFRAMRYFQTLVFLVQEINWFRKLRVELLRVYWRLLLRPVEPIEFRLLYILSVFQTVPVCVFTFHFVYFQFVYVYFRTTNFTMAQRCCIKKCTSVAAKLENRPSMFKFPDEGTEKHEEWLSALGDCVREGQSTRKRLYICDLHFQPDCFVESNNVILANDKEIVVPRKVKRLKNSAIPSIFKNAGSTKSTISPIGEKANNKINYEENCDVTVNTPYTKNAASTKSTISLIRKEENNKIKDEQNCDVSVKSPHTKVTDRENKGNLLILQERNPGQIKEKPSPALQQASKPLDFEFVNLGVTGFPAGTSQIQNTSNLNSTPFDNVASGNITTGLSGTNSCIMLGLAPLSLVFQTQSSSSLRPLIKSPVEKVCSVQKSKDIVQTPTNYQSLSTQPLDNKSLLIPPTLFAIRNDVDNNEKTTQSLVGLKSVPREWVDRTKLPKNWAATEFANGSVIFVYLSEELGQPTRSLLVRNDLTTEITAGGRIAKFPSFEKVTSFDEVHLLLLQIAHFQLCPGSDGSGCSNDVLFLPVPKSPSPRCKPCQKQRCLKRHMEWKRRNRKKAAASAVSQIKKKLRRCVQTVDSLQEKIKGLMEECIEIEKKDTKKGTPRSKKNNNSSCNPKSDVQKRKSSKIRTICETRAKLARK